MLFCSKSLSSHLSFDKADKSVCMVYKSHWVEKLCSEIGCWKHVLHYALQSFLQKQRIIRSIMATKSNQYMMLYPAALCPAWLSDICVFKILNKFWNKNLIKYNDIFTCRLRRTSNCNILGFAIILFPSWDNSLMSTVWLKSVYEVSELESLTAKQTLIRTTTEDTIKFAKASLYWQYFKFTNNKLSCFTATQPYCALK